MNSKEIEREIKAVVGIPEEETLINLYENEIKGKIYYVILTYSPVLKRKKSYRVKRRVEERILFLWKERHKALEKEKSLEQEIRSLITKYKDTNTVIQILQKVLEENLRRETRDYAYEKFKTKAFQLCEEFKPYLIKLKKEGLKRISLLQVLYLLANVKEMFKEKGEEETEKAIERAVKTILFRDKNQKLQSPFGVLKSDMFIPSKTEYDFLLSHFLEAELTPILEKLLEAEMEKVETQEAMAEISNFVANLSPKAKERVLKVFPSFSEFSKAIYKEWKKSRENLKEFLNELKSLLEIDISEKEEKHILEFLNNLK